MKSFQTVVYSLMGRLLKSGPVNKLKRALKRPVITLTPGRDRRRALGRAGKLSRVVVANGRRLLLVFLAVGLLTAACTPTSNPGGDLDLPDTGLTVEPGLEATLTDLIPTEGVPVAVQEAIGFLSVQTGVALEDIQILDFERVEWANACLELPQEGESCAEVITPGFRIELEANGQLYEVHTDEQGAVIRLR